MTGKKMTVLKIASLAACLCAPLFWHCTDVPDACSRDFNHPDYPDTEFCHDFKVVKKCGGKVYDPDTEFCAGNAVEARCGGGAYDPDKEFCHGNAVEKKCGGKEYDPAAQSCDGTTIVCLNGSGYDPSKNNPCDNGGTPTCTPGVNCPDDEEGYCTVNGTCDPAKTTRGECETAGGAFNGEPCDGGPETYALQVNRVPTAGGGVTVNPEQSEYAAGMPVTVTAEADNNYKFVKWTSNRAVAFMPDSSSQAAAFDMPAFDITVTANFARLFTVKVVSGAVAGGAVEGRYAKGDTVYVAANTPPDDSVFHRWTAAPNNVSFGSNSDSTTFFIMPDTAVTVRANYRGKSDTPPDEYEVKVIGGTGNGRFEAGADILITATTNNEVYRFVKWTSDHPVTFADSGESPTTFTMPAADVKVTANFTRIYKVSFDTKGGTPSDIPTVTVDSGKAMETKFPADPTRAEYTFGGWFDSVLTQYFDTTAIHKDVSLIATWNAVTPACTKGEDCDDDTVLCIVKSNCSELSRGRCKADGGNIVDACTYTLKASASPADGGTVTPADTTVSHGAKVTMKAVANTGYMFIGWFGSSASSIESSEVLSIDNMTENRTVTARFEPRKYTLTAGLSSGSPANSGTVDVSPTMPSGGYDHGTKVTVKAKPSAGYKFTVWQSAPAGVNSSRDSVTFEITGNVNMFAVFGRMTCTLTIGSATGGNVAVSSTPPSTSPYNYGTSITVTAAPLAGYIFHSWEGVPAEAATPRSASVTFEITGNVNMTAKFEGAVDNRPGAGTAKTTRYWDACKPSCGWSLNPDPPCVDCDVTGAVLPNRTSQSACGGGNSYACMFQAPFVGGDGRSYGFAASSVSGTCGSCYELTFTGNTTISGKKMVIMINNTGGDVASNLFELMIPGGGVGDFDALTPQLIENGVSDPQLGSERGGFRASCNGDKTCVKKMCDAAFSTPALADLKAGCHWYVDWFDIADNPDVSFTRVACPAELTDRYNGTDRTYGGQR